MLSRRIARTAVFSSLTLFSLCLMKTFALAPAGRPDAPRLNQLVASNVTSLEAKVKVVRADQTELAKINRDYGLAYRLNDLVMSYKEPNRLRMEGNIGFLIFNGSKRMFKVPKLRLTKKDDLGDSPGRKWSLLDVGVLTPGGLAAIDPKFVRNEPLDGAPTQVFDFTFRGDDTAKYTVWVDPATHRLLKRDWFDAAGKRRATFRYLEPKEVAPGLWVPTRIEILNAEGVVAGVTAYSELKINQKIDDALFEIS